MGFVDSDRMPTEDELASRPAFCGWYMQQYSQTQEMWKDLYFFTEQADLQPDFVMMNFWIANHHSSIFREVRLKGLRDLWHSRDLTCDLTRDENCSIFFICVVSRP